MTGRMIPDAKLAPIISLSQTVREICTLDYELHASLRILAAGERFSPRHLEAFLAAKSRHDRLMNKMVKFARYGRSAESTT